jgi:tRNA pseudouridine55 synthase
MGHLRRTATDPFDDRDLRTLQDLVDALAWAEDGDDALLREVVRPAEDALTHLPAVTVARSAARNVATGAPVYAPGVIDVDDAAVPATVDGQGPDAADGGDAPLVACFTPDGTAVCLGRVVGDPTADGGEVVALERVLL